ncbi:hypothetical protein SAMN05428983_0860 [Agrobacterium fabrum]|uniref:Uncharacterized protein n=1 Tax=Agrobacterium fabrum TaxID=1176649 RepID=A0A7Z7BHP5_9HYPH|nr:hypothetical protein [Agrobacterium fabrum]SDJ25862.1 hypothetical protein SAMN05428983_0860 [Agrobacterium fabrum]
MNIFDKIVGDQAALETSLGAPLRDTMAIQRRLTHFAALTGGRGFRTPKKVPKVDAQGMTRGDRKRARQTKVFAS